MFAFLSLHVSRLLGIYETYEVLIIIYMYILIIYEYTHFLICKLSHN